MKKLMFIFIALCCCFTAYADALKNLSQRLTSVHSVIAAFTQTITDGQGQELQSVTGVMRILKPGYFWWQIQKPNEQLILIKNNKVYFYQADLEQLTVKPFDANVTQTPATLLLNGSIDVLAKQYRVHQETDRDAVIFTLLPKMDNQLLKSIVISFRGDTLEELDLADHLDHVTRVSFRDVSVNPAISASSFAFKLPKGTDVINQ